MILKPPKGAMLNRGHPLARGLAGLWLMNESGGNIVNDLSGNGITGTLQGTASLVPCKYGSGLSSLNSGEYIDLGSPSQLDLLGDHTILAWIKTSHTGCVGIYNKLTDGGSYTGLTFQLNGTVGVAGQMTYYSGGVGTWRVANSIGIDDGNWHQVAVVVDHDSGGTFYLDGKPDGGWSGSSEGALYDASNAELGRNYEDIQMYGFMDHAMIWNRTFSASEIFYLYRSPFCMFEVDL